MEDGEQAKKANWTMQNIAKSKVKDLIKRGKSKEQIQREEKEIVRKIDQLIRETK